LDLVKITRKGVAAAPISGDLSGSTTPLYI